jgi:protoporphyrinogen oxidase
VIDFFWCIRNLLAADAFCIRGGMDRIVAGVACHLDVSLGTEAVDVVPLGETVSVRLRDKSGRHTTELVDFCVIATRSRDVPAIHRGLDDASRRFLAELAYTATTDLHLRLSARPEEKAAVVMVPDPLEPDICTLLFQHNKGSDRVPAGKGAVSAYFHHRWASKVAHLPDEQVFETGMVKLERVIPGIGKLVEGYHVQRWDFTATKSYPGYYKRLAEFMRGVDFGSRVQLAGDYFAMACVNTAVTSGENAAARLIAKYL